MYFNNIYIYIYYRTIDNYSIRVHRGLNKINNTYIHTSESLPCMSFGYRRIPFII